MTEALRSPTMLTMRRGLRRPSPNKPLLVASTSSSQSGNYSISSRATSRRSKSIISTPEEQRLFDSMNATLTVSTSASHNIKNKLDRFQQKKNMALANTTPSATTTKVANKKSVMIHPSQQGSIQESDEESRKEAEAERFFSVGGALGLNNPGKVTPIIYKVATILSAEEGLSPSATHSSYFYSNDSGDSAFVRNDDARNVGNTYDSGDSAFVRINDTPTLGNTLDSGDDSAFVRIESVTTNDSSGSAFVRNNDATVTTEGDTTTMQTSSSGRASSRSRSLLSRFFASMDDNDDDDDDDDGEVLSTNLSPVSLHSRASTTTKSILDMDDEDEEREADDEKSSNNLSTTGGDTTSCCASSKSPDDNTVNDSVNDLVGKGAQSQVSSLFADIDNSAASRSAVGDATFTSEGATFATFASDEENMSKKTRSRGKESRLVYSSTFGTVELGEATSTTGDRSTIKSDKGGTTDGQSNNTVASRSHRGHSSTQGDSQTENCSLSQIIVRPIDDTKIKTARSVETYSGVVRRPDPKKKQGDPMKEDCEDSQEIKTIPSDLSDITTLSLSQNRIQLTPMMNYSNLFSNAGSTVWSSYKNMEREDQLFMSRAQTLLDFFEARLSADRAEVTLAPEDKSALDKMFNISTRLRFIDSLRMRCVVKGKKTQTMVKQCCRFGLDREGAENPIFAARALHGKQSVTVKLPILQSPKKDQSNENASTFISQLSIHSSEWDPVAQKGMKVRPKLIQPDCSMNMCGISFLVCVKEDHE